MVPPRAAAGTEAGRRFWRNYDGSAAQGLARRMRGVPVAG